MKCWPALIVFDEISKYPEYATPLMLRRLERVRKTTQDFHYTFAKQVKVKDSLKDYIFFKGEVIEKPFLEFLKED